MKRLVRTKVGLMALLVAVGTLVGIGAMTTTASAHARTNCAGIDYRYLHNNRIVHKCNYLLADSMRACFGRSYANPSRPGRFTNAQKSIIAGWERRLGYADDGYPGWRMWIHLNSCNGAGLGTHR